MKAGSRLPTRNNAELVRFRLDRQRVLRRPNPPEYEAIIGEAALRQQVGGATVMRPQLERLLETRQGGRMTLHVLPFSANAHLGIAGSFDIFRLRPPGRLTVTMVEDFTQSTFIESETEVARFERIFTYFRSSALDEASSQRIIREIASGI